MEGSKERIKAILDKIADEIFRAHLYFSVAKSLNEKYRAQEISGTNYFFAASYFACLREAILSLCKIFLNDQDSINFNYLLNHATNHPSEFRHKTKDEVANIVRECQEKLTGLADFFNKVETLRDKELAHFDRKHLNDPTAIIPNSITFSEIENSLTILSNILDHVNTAYDGTINILDYANIRVKSDIDLLMSLINLNSRSH